MKIPAEIAKEMKIHFATTYEDVVKARFLLNSECERL